MRSSLPVLGVLLLVLHPPLFVTATLSVSSQQQLLQLFKSRLPQIEQFRARVHSTIRKFYYDPNSTILASHFPATVVANFHQKLTHLDKCYKSSLSGQRFNIFTTPLKVIVEKYMKLFNKHDKSPQSNAQIAQKTKNLLRTIKIVAHVVLECLHNIDNPSYTPTRISLNKFAILSKKELSQMRMKLHHLGRNMGEKSPEIADDNIAFDVKAVANTSLPAVYDYRTLGVVSPIKDQGMTGTCFVFATIAAIESAYMLQYNRSNIRLSERDVCNCLIKLTKNKHPQNGGAVQDVMYVAKHHGTLPEARVWPFLPKQPSAKMVPFVAAACRNLTKKQIVTKVKGFAAHYGDDLNDTSGVDELTLKKILYKYGPVTVLIRSPFKNEVLAAKWNGLNGPMDFACDAKDDIGHAMTLVGWNEKYFIFKNSYGIDPLNTWGINGYLYLNRKYLKSCGITGKNSQTFFPMVA